MRRLPVEASGLERELDSLTAAGELYQHLDGGALRCYACAHHCVIAEGSRGACGTRINREGELRVPFGYVARRYVRAVETNTIFHLAPGARALTFGMFGCDLRCPYCQNHVLSQALRKGASSERPSPCTAAQLVDEAVAADCAVVCAAYNEPMISAEWMRAVFAEAKRRELLTAIVSDGHSTPEALRYLRPVTDVFRVDLKAATEKGYKTLGGRMQPVLDSIELAKRLGFWVEVVTLVVPGLNQDLKAIAHLGAQLRELDPNLPWHLNGFIPRYELAHQPPTDPLFLTMAAGAAYVAGSRFVYVGNVARLAELAHTRCPDCHSVLVRRQNYETVENDLLDGRCKHCGTEIPGLWHRPAPPLLDYGHRSSADSHCLSAVTCELER